MGFVHVFLFLALVWNFGLAKAEDELLSVIVLFRHGDRAPLRFYPTDPYAKESEKLWPDGLGALINDGKDRHYNLGAWFRTRYSKFLSNLYSSKEIKVYSTDVDRTLMSAQLNLAGLYPPKDRQIWNEKLSWQPIPVHIVPESFVNDLYICLKYDFLFLENLFSPEIRKLDEENKDLYEYIANHTGIPYIDLPLVYSLHDTLFVEASCNLTLPEWAKSIYPRLSNLSGLMFDYFGFNPEMRKLASGPFLQHVVDHFGKVAKGWPSEKFVIFSGHDVNIATVLHGMDAFEPHNPPYASTVIFELRKNSGGEYVNVFYKNSTDANPISVQGCDVDCPLEEFKDRLKDHVMNSIQWTVECATFKNESIRQEIRDLYKLS